MDRQELKDAVFAIFSDTLMVFLALLIIPIVISEYLFDLAATQNMFISIANWIIYSIFFLEFILKVLVVKNRVEYLKSKKFDTIISLTIIFSPLFEPLSAVFEAAPLLRALRISRIIRLSRLSRLIAASSRARMDWKQINFRSYAILTVIIAIGFFGSFFKLAFQLNLEDQTSFMQFIQVIGSIYAIITGFTIANSWNKYTNLINALRNETQSLRNVYLMTWLLKDQKYIRQIKENILDYLNSLIDAYWKRKADISLTEERSIKVLVSLKDYQTDNPENIEIFSNLYDELRNSSEHRATILSLLAAKVPKILWSLLVTLSSLLILGFYLMSYENQFLATLSITMVSTSIALVAVIIYDMNDPFKWGFWAVSPDPYLELIDFLKKS